MICPVCRGDMLREGDNFVCVVCGAEIRTHYDEPKWIPVTERLPEERINPNTQDFEYVLCTTTWGDVRPFKFGSPFGWKEPHFWHGCGVMDEYVTHWMPLPTPPEEEEP